jgi:S-methylmethionine-dependent homocysteine/selenocysteine methylase
VEQAVALDVQRGAQSICFNCSQPEVMNAAVLAAAATIEQNEGSAVRIGVYANAFAPEPVTPEPYAGISDIRQDVSPERYLQWALEWVRSGATIIGGCCGIGPEHIAALRAQLG